MAEPLIISSYDGGRHNASAPVTIRRLEKEAAYKDVSCVMVVPALDSVPTRVVASWMDLMTMPNGKFTRMWAQGLEVGEAYSKTIEMILSHPELSKWKYILTLEHDNCPPSDGIVRLLRRMEEHPEFSAIGGLYYTKYEGGVAQVWGDPNDHPLNFRPQLPNPEGLKECCGTGMGFTMFRMSMFKDERLRKPWFKTTASSTEGAFSQDLYFWSDARKHGHRCAIDGTIRVGHWCSITNQMW